MNKILKFDRCFTILMALAMLVTNLGFRPARAEVAATNKAAKSKIAQPGKANNPKAPPSKLKYPRTRGDARAAILAMFQRGVDEDWAAAYQMQKLQTYLNALSSDQVSNVAGVLNTTPLEVARVFILKSFIAGEPWENLVTYAAEMREHSQDEIISRSTMRDDMDLIQQWQDACGPSMLQTVAGETDPRYAWELNKLGDISIVDPLGASSMLALQQKQWLEENGGQAVPRGQTGRGISMTEFLNKALGPIVGATYVCQVSADLDTTLNRVSAILQNGYDVPLCVGWDETGNNNHFLVMLASRGQSGNREFQIHDTWTGKTAWVGENSIRDNTMPPIFGVFTKLTHYYEPVPTK